MIHHAPGPAPIFALLLVAGCGGGSGLGQEPPTSPATVQIQQAQGATPAAQGAAPAAAASDAPVVVPLTDLGVEITIPPGWRAVGDDEIVTNLRRLDARERADEVWKRRKAGGGLVLALLQTHAKNPSERINVMVQTVDRPSEADAVAMLAHEKSVLAGKFEESTVLDEPHAIGGDGGLTAEMTEQHVLRRNDGGVERLAMTLRLFVLGDKVLLLGVSWQGARERPAEATRMHDIVARVPRPR